MSRRRKKVRGNPATEHESSQQPQGATPAPRPTSRTRGGMLADANERATEPGASNPRILVYALLAVCLFLFTYLHLFALPQMMQFAGGFSMPDSRVAGYGVEEINQLRSIMDESATGQLNFLHKTAGILFPVSFALTAWAVAGLIMRRGVFRWVVLALAVLFAMMDIAENFLIDRILTMEPLDHGLVALTSTLTVSSWLLLVVVGACVLGSVVLRMIRSSVERANGSQRES